MHCAVIGGIEKLCRATDMFAACKDLWDRLNAGARMQRGADLATKVVVLIFDRIEIHRSVRDLVFREHLAYRPTELAPLERVQVAFASMPLPLNEAGVKTTCAPRKSRGCCRRWQPSSRRSFLLVMAIMPRPAMADVQQSIDRTANASSGAAHSSESWANHCPRVTVFNRESGKYRQAAGDDNGLLRDPRHSTDRRASFYERCVSTMGCTGAVAADCRANNLVFTRARAFPKIGRIANAGRQFRYAETTVNRCGGAT